MGVVTLFSDSLFDFVPFDLDGMALRRLFAALPQLFDRLA